MEGDPRNSCKSLDYRYRVWLLKFPPAALLLPHDLQRLFKSVPVHHSSTRLISFARERVCPCFPWSWIVLSLLRWVNRPDTFFLLNSRPYRLSKQPRVSRFLSASQSRACPCSSCLASTYSSFKVATRSFKYSPFQSSKSACPSSKSIRSSLSGQSFRCDRWR